MRQCPLLYRTLRQAEGRGKRLQDGRQRDFHCPGYPSALYPHWLAEWGRGPCVCVGGQHPPSLHVSSCGQRLRRRVRLVTRETAAGSMGFLKNGKVLSGFQMQDGLWEPAPIHGFLSQPLCSPSGCPRTRTRRQETPPALCSLVHRDSGWQEQLAHMEGAGDDGSCGQDPENMERQMG